jgi:hypothetical protein
VRNTRESQLKGGKIDLVSEVSVHHGRTEQFSSWQPGSRVGFFFPLFFFYSVRLCNGDTHIRAGLPTELILFGNPPQTHPECAFLIT